MRASHQMRLRHARGSCSDTALPMAFLTQRSVRTSANMSATASRPTAIRGPALTFTGDPFRDGLDKTMVHEPDAIVAMAGGRITHFGPASRVLQRAAGRHRDPRLRQGRADLGGLHRHPRPLPADADDRGLRRAAARLAEPVHLPGRAEIRRQGLCPQRRAHLPAREPAQRHHHELRLLHRPSAFGRRAVRGGRDARPAARRRQGADGSQRPRGAHATRRSRATTSRRR